MSDKPHRFVLQSGADAGRIFELTAASITIGRYPLADIVIDNPDVAYRHALLTRGDTSYRIADLGSDSGTYVNGQRITAEPVTLKHGDIVLLGSRLSAAYLEHDIDIAGEEKSSPVPRPVEGVAPVDELMDTPATRDEMAESLVESVNEYEPPAFTVEESAGLTAAASDRATIVEASAHEAHHPGPLPAMPPPQKNRNGRIALIAAGCLVALLACCCSSTLFMYFIGGDWLLRLLGYVP